MRVISIRANVNQALAAFQDHMRDISRFMRQEKLSSSLQKYEYIKFCNCVLMYVILIVGLFSGDRIIIEAYLLLDICLTSHKSGR